MRGLLDRLGAINPSARVLEAAFGETDAGELFRPDDAGSRAMPKAFGGEPHYAGETHSVSLTFDGPVDWTAFGIWLSMLLHARGEDVLRVKGLLDVGERGPVVVNGVQHTIHPPEHLDRWPDENHRSRIVFIARGIRPEELLGSLEAFRGLLGARPMSLGAEQGVPSS